MLNRPLETKYYLPLQIWEYAGFFIEATLETEILRDFIGKLILSPNKINNKLQITLQVNNKYFVLLNIFDAYCFAPCADLHEDNCSLPRTKVKKTWAGVCWPNHQRVYYATLPSRQIRTAKGLISAHIIKTPIEDIFEQLIKEKSLQKAFSFEPVTVRGIGVFTESLPNVAYNLLHS